VPALEHPVNERDRVRIMRIASTVSSGLVAALAVAGLAAAPAHAASPYPVNIRVHEHKATEFDPNWLFESPCFNAVGDLTEVLNAEAHALAAGLDVDGNFVAPMHVQKTVEESVLFVPYDSSLPTYSGHSSVHVTNTEDSPNAGFSNTVTLRGSDGSHLVLHQNVHIRVKANGIALTVENDNAHC
jgi:hypothetical protein